MREVEGGGGGGGGVPPVSAEALCSAFRRSAQEHIGRRQPSPGPRNRLVVGSQGKGGKSCSARVFCTCSSCLCCRLVALVVECFTFPLRAV